MLVCWCIPASAQSPGPLVVLLSVVAVLQNKCGLQPNVSNMRTIVRENGFDLDDFLPTGTYAEPMRKQILSGYDFLRQKGHKRGCAILREGVRRNFPAVLSR